MEKQNNKLNSKLINSIIFVIIIFITAFINIKHEIWRDEAQAWLISRDCKNLSDFLYIMHHEGSPYLWHIILMPFAKIGFPIFTIKVIIFLLSVSSAYLVIFKSSFNYVHKILIILGYYFIYEYSAISRSYGLSLFLILLLAQCYKYRFDKVKTYLLIIFLFCNTNIHSAIIGFFIFLNFVYELFKIEKLNGKKCELAVSIIGFIIIFLEVLPSDDLMSSLKIISSHSIMDGYKMASAGLLAAFFPIPEFNKNFWNSLYLYNFATYYYGLIAYCFILRLFYKDKNLFRIFLLSSLSLAAFFILKGIPGVRHTGIIYLSFLFCLWIIIEKKLCDDNFNKAVIYVLLMVQVFSAVIAVNYDIKYSFSNAKYAADFIESNTNINDTVIMYPSSYGASLIANLRSRKKLYYFQNNGLGSYTVWNQHYEDIANLDQGTMFLMLEKYMEANNKKQVYLILAQQLTAGSRDYKSKLVYKKEGSIKEEDYFIYKIQYVN